MSPTLWSEGVTFQPGLFFMVVKIKKKVMAKFCAYEIMLCTCTYTGVMQATEPAEREFEVRKIKRYLESILSELDFFFFYRIKNVS